MPEGYWSAAGFAVGAGALIAAVIVTLAYWLRVPFDGYSILMPVLALMNTAIAALFAAVAATLAGLVTKMVLPSRTILGATGVYVLAVFAILGSEEPSTAEIGRALGGLRFLVPTAMAAVWIGCVARPLLARRV